MCSLWHTCVTSRVYKDSPGLEKSGRIVTFCDWKLRFATRKLGAVATLRLKPDDQAYHCDQMNIFRDQVLNTTTRNGFRSPTRTKESDVSLASCLWQNLLQTLLLQTYLFFHGYWLTMVLNTETLLSRIATFTTGFVLPSIKFCIVSIF